MSRAAKISVTIDGHRTSISLEPEFWSRFGRLCGDLGQSRTAVLAEIDRTRDGPLSGAVRLWVLAALEARRGPAERAAGGG